MFAITKFPKIIIMMRIFFFLQVNTNPAQMDDWRTQYDREELVNSDQLQDSIYVNEDHDNSISTISHGLWGDHVDPADYPSNYWDQNSNVNQSTTGGGIETGLTVYKRRWYVLFLFALLCFTQGSVWGTWGPISTSVSYAFGWSDHDIAILTNWGPIMYVLTAPLFTWILDTKGIRVTCVITSGLVTMGTALRCITHQPPLVTWLVNAGQIVNALAGPVCFGTATVISSTWFPVEQRTSATAIASILNGLGVAMTYIIGPLVVPTNLNGTLTYSSEEYVQEHTISEMRSDVMLLMYVSCGWSLLLFIAILFTFPTKPPTPPSVTASLTKLNYTAGLRKLIKTGKFWTLAFCFAIPTSFQGGWSALLNINLGPLGISQVSAGWLGFAMSIAGNFCALSTGVFADRFKRKMKLSILTLYSVALLSVITFTLMYIETIPYSTSVVWITTILSCVGVWAPTPLFFELACEVCYPIPETIANMAITWLCQVPFVIFLAIQTIPGIGVEWMTWSFLGSIIITLPILYMFKEEYSRLDIDTQNVTHVVHSIERSVNQVPAYLHGDVTPHPLYN